MQAAKDRLHKLDIRFEEKEDERQFGIFLEDQVILSAKVCCAIYCTLNTLVWVSVYWSEAAREDKPFAWDPDDPRTQAIAMAFIASIVTGVVGLLATLRQRKGWFSTWHWEKIILVMAIYFVLQYILSGPWYVATMRSRDPADVWMQSSVSSDPEKQFVIMVDMITTAICLWIPIRVHLLWIYPVSTVLAFLLVIIAVGSPFPDSTLYNIIWTAVLCFFSYVGAHRHEQHVRKEWYALRQVEDQLVQIRDTSALAKGMQAVASFLCDVVVELSEDLKVLDDKHILDDFFGVDMNRRCFTDVLAASDRSRFASLIKHVTATQIPQCLSVTIEGFVGNFAANLLVVAGFRGRLSYFIGVRYEDPSSPKLSPKQQKAAWSVPDAPRTISSSGCVFEKVKHHIQSSGANMELLLRLLDQGEHEQWLIDTSSMEMYEDCVLGKGSFTVVVSASFHGTEAAVKIANANQQPISFCSQLPNISGELRTMRQLSHPNITSFFGACIDSATGEIALVSEQLRGKVLDEFVRAPHSDPGTSCRHLLARDICAALRYLHALTPAVVHGDLKSSNVFVELSTSSSPRAKLLDVGASRAISTSMAPSSSTRSWRAPEIADHTTKPAPPADIFSLGLLIRFLVTGSKPQDEKDGKNDILASPDIPLSSECSLLCEKCLQWEWIRRPTAKTVHSMVSSWRTGEEAIDLLPGNTFAHDETTASFEDALMQVRKSMRLKTMS